MPDRPQTDDNNGPPAHPAKKSKVVRLLDRYDLEELGQELEASWTRPTEPASLRDLATRFNHRLLEATMDNAGATPLDGEIENTYRLLTDDNVSPGAATEARRRLERAGVDVDQLKEDFVSRQAIHTYLTKVRGVTNQQDDENPVENAESYLRNLKQRTATITQSRITQLREAAHLSIGSPRVLVDIQILCENCGQQYSLEELFASGSCACDSSEDPGP